MTHSLALLVALLLLAGAAAADPRHVDGGWQRSDDVPQETPTAPPPEVIPAPTAPPETATEPEAAEAGWRGYGLILCFAMIMISLWYCRMGAKR